MTEMFGEAWSPMSVPDLAPDDDDEAKLLIICFEYLLIRYKQTVIELLPALKSSRVPTFKSPKHLTNKKKSKQGKSQPQDHKITKADGNKAEIASEKRINAAPSKTDSLICIM